MVSNQPANPLTSPAQLVDPFIYQQRGELSVLYSPLCADLGVDLVVTTRRGGVSTASYGTLNVGNHVGDDEECVRENRRRVASAVAVDSDDLIFVSQTHGVDVAYADRHNAGDVISADIVLLCGEQRAAAIMVADCVALALIDPTSHSIALVHAGWRGLTRGALRVAHAAIETSDSLVAVMAPSISRRQYQVGPEVVEHFAHIDGAHTPDIDDRSLLDLRLIAQHQLTALGVDESRILASSEYTDGGSTFFSDRAQRPCGRFALVAKWCS